MSQKAGYLVDSTLGAASGAAAGALSTLVGSAALGGAAPAIGALAGLTAAGAAAGAVIGALVHRRHPRAPEHSREDSGEPAEA
jgi:hypothetical protein